MGLSKPLAEVSESDLLELRQRQLPEGKSIEYKRSLPGPTSEDRREFLADVSSFANAGGGHLIFGIAEEEGVPTDVCGVVEDVDVDAEILRLENLARDGLEPRLPVLDFHAVQLDRRAPAIVTRIGASWIAPHMVTFRNSAKFYSRTSAGKYQLSVSEIRSAVLLSETATDRIRDFRVDRIAKVRAGETSVVLGDTGKIMLQIVPFGVLGTPAQVVDPQQLAEAARGRLLPLYGGIEGVRFNFDGFLMYDSSGQPPDEEPVGYLQVFRNGTIEAVDAKLLTPRREEKLIPITLVEQNLIEASGSYLRFQRDIGVEPPFFVMVTLMDVHGYRVPQARGHDARFNVHLIDRDILPIPELIVDEFDIDIPRMLKPALDAIWHAGDWPGSPHFDLEGRWMGSVK